MGRTKFTDQFQWDLQSEITPEEFANILCSDLSLGSEFPMLIAHAIREQLQRHLMEFGEMETNPAETGVFRESTAIQEWGPAVEELNDEDLDQYLRLQERHARRLRRESSKFSRRY